MGFLFHSPRISYGCLAAFQLDSAKPVALSSVCPTVRTVTVLESCTILYTQESCTVRTAASEGLYVWHKYVVLRESSELPKLKFKRGLRHEIVNIYIHAAALSKFQHT